MIAITEWAVVWAGLKIQKMGLSVKKNGEHMILEGPGRSNADGEVQFP